MIVFCETGCKFNLSICLCCNLKLLNTMLKGKDCCSIMFISLKSYFVRPNV